MTTRRIPVPGDRIRVQCESDARLWRWAEVISHDLGFLYARNERPPGRSVSLPRMLRHDQWRFPEDDPGLTAGKNGVGEVDAILPVDEHVEARLRAATERHVARYNGHPQEGFYGKGVVTELLELQAALRVVDHDGNRLLDVEGKVQSGFGHFADALEEMRPIPRDDKGDPIDGSGFRGNVSKAAEQIQDALNALMGTPDIDLARERIRLAMGYLDRAAID